MPVDAEPAWLQEFGRLHAPSYGEAADLEAKVRQNAARVVAAFAGHRHCVDLLELGCGNGRLLQCIREAVSQTTLRMTGVDSSPEMLAVAARRTALGSVHFVEQRLVDYLDQIDEGTMFDLVLCCNTLHLLGGRQAILDVLRRMRSIVKPGGVIVIDIRNSYSPILNLAYRWQTRRGRPFSSLSPFRARSILRKEGFTIECFEPIHWTDAKEAVGARSASYLRLPFSYYLWLTKRLPFCQYVLIAANRV